MPTVVIMWVINVVLFCRLFTNDVLRCRLVRQPADNDLHVLNDKGTVTAVVNNNHTALPSDRRNKAD